MDTGSLTWRVSPDLLGVLDTQCIFMETNPAWLQVLGLSAGEIESQPFFGFVHPDDIARTEAAFRDLQNGTPVLHFENRYRHKDGSYRWLSWNAVPEDGLYFCSARDVTSDKMNAAELRESVDEGEQIVAVLGHDLRNPVAALRAAMRLLWKQPQTESSRQITEMAGHSVERMSGLIDNVMEFTHAKLGGGLKVAPVETALRPTLERTVQEIRLANPDARLVEEFRFADPVRSDPQRIAQLLSNLLSNAVTHGEPRRPITIRAWDEDGAFSLSVSNSGAPIPAEIMPMLFEPFARAEARKSQNGLGLGLYIASEIARNHGGRLGVVSGAGRTTFTLTLPRN